MSSTRILIVEDEAIVARDIGQQLTELGYDVVGTTSMGHSGLELAARLRPDLVLMDIQLAGDMDGITAAQRIREELAIPVVFLTAFAGEAILQRAKLAQPFGYIIKPFEDRELRTVIEMALYKHQNEAEREITVRLLQLTNGQNNLHELMQSVTQLLHNWSGCEAVGIRLRHGDDFPYFETRGFPPEFVQTESHLCSRDAAGGVARDSAGNPVLECMCGNILCGRADPSKPFFTAHGSFWSNCTTQLLASTTDADRQTRTRNRCNGEGYESVALLPLRAGVITYGLLQLNDKRRDRFTPERIALLERLADNLAGAVALRQSQEALTASELRFRTLTQVAPSGIYLTDATGKCEYVNDKWCEMAGMSAADARGDGWSAAVHPDDRQRVLDAWQRMSASDQLWHYEYRFRTPAGKITALLGVATALRDRNGQITGYLGVNTDITEHQRLEEQFRQAQKMEAIGQLAGGVAHDFNNILAAILMELGLLQEEANLSPEMRESLRELENESRRAASLTRQLLAFSRRQIMQVKPVDVNDLLSQLLRMLRRLLGEHITVSLEKQAEPAWVEADTGMLEQVAINLCVNARDAMPQGGRLTLRTATVKVDEAMAAANPEARPGGFLRLSVADTGCGMSPDILQHVCEPFFTTKELGKGTGLGLATVFGIIKQHSGWMEVSSTVAQGSTFTLYLPTTTPPPPEAAEVDGALVHGHGHCHGHGQSVLLVEDEQSVRRLVAATLRRHGYQVFEAVNGPDAMGVWKTHAAEIELLFTDMLMPGGITGQELAARLREDKPGLKVILSTGYSQTMAGTPLTADASMAMLPKPYDPAALLAILRRSLTSPGGNNQ